MLASQIVSNPTLRLSFELFPSWLLPSASIPTVSPSAVAQPRVFQRIVAVTSGTRLKFVSGWGCGPEPILKPSKPSQPQNRVRTSDRKIGNPSVQWMAPFSACHRQRPVSTPNGSTLSSQTPLLKFATG